MKEEINYQNAYRKFNKRYLIALILLLLIFFVKQFVVYYEIVREENTATIINVAGRQRMLSQKMVKDILHIQNNNNEVELEYYINELSESYLLWEKSHYDLKDNKLTKGLQHNNTAVITYLYEDMEPVFLELSEQIEAILQDTSENQIITHAKIIKLNEAESIYLNKMDEMVNAYNVEAKEAVFYMKLNNGILSAIIIGMILFISFCILKPISNILKKAFLELAETNENIIELLQTMKGAIFLIKRDGTIQIMNEDAEKIIIFDKIQTGNFSVVKNVKWLEIDILGIINEVQAGKRIEDIETLIENKEGDKLSVMVSGVLGKYKGEEVILLSLFDITEQKKVEETLMNKVVRDELTGLYNRHFLDSIIDEEINRSERYEVPLSALLLDLDHFKRVNDQWGHPVGDSVLKYTADILLKETRMSDYAIRIGGEEFLVLMPHTNIEGAVMVAEKLRKIIETSIHPVIGKFTASFGVAERNCGETYRMLYNRVDHALYEAKTTGRNRVVRDPLEESYTSFTFKWNRSWNCKDEKLNEQHRKLFVMTSRLADNSFLLEDREKAIITLDEIIKHITEHFTYEEEALKRVGYKYVNNHRNIHENLAIKAKDVRNKVTAGELDGKDAVTFIFEEVIVGHLLREDVKFYECFEKNALQ